MSFVNFKNKKTHYAGYSFASKGEASLFAILKLQEKAGELKDVQVQDHVYLTRARILFIPDFKYFDSGLNKNIWAEFKGIETDVWRIKRRLWMHYGPGILLVYKANYRGVYLHEEVIPSGEENDANGLNNGVPNPRADKKSKSDKR